MNRGGSSPKIPFSRPDSRTGRDASVLPFRPAASPPRVWLLIGDKLGDNQQVELIANRLTQRLNWRVDVRRLQFKDAYRTGKPQFRVDHSHVDWSASDSIAPPWPDLVITIGRRPSMVALWIKEQSRGKTQIVIVGRPRRWLQRFDLIIAAAHHHVPQLPNVLRLGLPLIMPDKSGLEVARAQWASRFANLSRPLVALFVGGPTKPHVFDRDVASELMARASECVAESGGTLWVTTSPRTSPDVVDAIEEALPESGRLFRFRPNDPNNPYLGLLASADQFIVTGDSVSMQVEVARLGKPLAIYPLPVEYGIVERVRRAAARIAYGQKTTLLSRLIQVLQRIGITQFPRDVEEIHALLFKQGFAVRLGEPFKNHGAGVDVDLDQIVDRVHALVVEEESSPLRGQTGWVTGGR
jgi:mitochondrial fission protein ELM1